MASYETWPVLGVHVRLTPVRTESGLAPTPAIYEEIHETGNAAAALFAPHAITLRAYLGQLQILCRAEKEKDIWEIYRKTSALLRLLDERNERLRESGATFYFRHAVAEDFQLTPVRRVPPLPLTPESLLFPGTIPERLDKIANHMPAELTIPVLITHALYEKLPPKEREPLTTCYYIMHICCYGK